MPSLDVGSALGVADAGLDVAVEEAYAVAVLALAPAEPLGAQPEFDGILRIVRVRAVVGPSRCDPWKLLELGHKVVDGGGCRLGAAALLDLGDCILHDSGTLALDLLTNRAQGAQIESEEWQLIGAKVPADDGCDLLDGFHRLRLLASATLPRIVGLQHQVCTAPEAENGPAGGVAAAIRLVCRKLALVADEVVLRIDREVPSYGRLVAGSKITALET